MKKKEKKEEKREERRKISRRWSKMIKLYHNNSFSTNAPSNNNNSFVITLDGAHAINYE